MSRSRSRRSIGLPTGYMNSQGRVRIALMGESTWPAAGACQDPARLRSARDDPAGVSPRVGSALLMPLAIIANGLFMLERRGPPSR